MKCFCVKSIVLLIAFLSAENYAFAQTDTIYSIQGVALSTGRTTGHIADVIFQNSVDVSLTVVPQIFYIPSLNNFQPYVACIRERQTIHSGDTARVRIEGFCADVTKPAVPAGRQLPPVNSWIPVNEEVWLGAQVGGILVAADEENILRIANREAVSSFQITMIPDITSDPGFVPLSDSTGIIPTWPGSETPVEGIVTDTIRAESIAPVLVEAVNRIATAYDEMHNENNKFTPLAPYPEREREGVIQQVFWMYTTALAGGEYIKDVFVERTYNQYQIKTGIPTRRLRKDQVAELDTGITSFWNAFLATGVRANLFQPTGIEAEVSPVLISAQWDDMQLYGVGMKPGPLKVRKPFPKIPFAAGVVGLGTGAYFVLKKEDFSELCAFTLSSETTNSSCGLENGRISVFVNPPGDYFYSWSSGPSGNSTLSSLNRPGGIYTITVRPQRTECSHSITDTIVDVHYEFTTDITTTNASCGANNGSATLTVNPPGDYDYLWSNQRNGPVQSDLVAGKYRVTVTLEGLCTEEYQFNINEEGIPFIIETSTSPAQCGVSDGSAIALVNPIGDYTYQWSNGSTTASIGNIPAGTYSVTVAQAGSSCDTVVTVVVDEPPADFIIDATPVAGNCDGTGADIILQLQSHGPGPLVITATGPAGAEVVYFPEGAAHLNTALTLLPGTWHLEVRDLHLNPTCIAETTVIVPDSTATLSPMDDFYETTIDEPVHGNLLNNDTGYNLHAYISTPPNSGSVMINQDGTFIYTPQPGLSGPVTFTYLVQDGCGNWEVRIVSINVQDCLIDASFVVTPPACGMSNGSVLTQVNPPASYGFEWSSLDNTQDLQNIPAGQYAVTITNNDLGCDRIYFVDVRDTSMLEITVHEFFPPTEPSAMDGYLNLRIISAATPPYLIFLNGAVYGMISGTDFTVEGLGAGQHTIYLQDAAGCLSNILNAVVPLPGLLGLEVGFGLAMMQGVPIPLPEQLKTNGHTMVTSFVDLGLHYPVGGIIQLGSVAIYRDIPFNIPAYRFSHLVEIGRWRYKGFDFKTHGGLSLDVIRDIPAEQYWMIKGSVSRRIGKMMTANAAVTLRGWESLEIPTIEVEVKLPVIFDGRYAIR